MPGFKGTDFEIELPQGVSDESTYAFTLPASANFRPSVVIKTERLAKATALESYVQKQIENLTKILPNVVVASGTATKHGSFPAYVCVYDWGEPAQRVRQKQRYIFLPNPERVVTLTGTNLRDDFDQTDALFDAVFQSFRPVGT